MTNPLRGYALVHEPITAEMRDEGWRLLRGNLRPDEIYSHMTKVGRATALESALGELVEAVQDCQTFLIGYRAECLDGGEEAYADRITRLLGTLAKIKAIAETKP